MRQMILLLPCAMLVSGLVRRSDKKDADYIVDAADYPELVMLQAPGDYMGCPRQGKWTDAGGAATLLTPKFLITAAHVMCHILPALEKVRVCAAGQERHVVKKYLDPACKFSCITDGPNRCDVGIMELDSAVTTPGLRFPRVYNGSDEAGKVITMLGWGVSGDAATISADDCQGGDEDGKLRKGRNIVAKVDAPSSGGGVIYYTMLKNSAPNTLPDMCIDAAGDSGGPAFITGSDNVTYIAGVNSGNNDKNGCRYGDTDQHGRISPHYAWIQSVLNGEATPEP